MNVDYSFAQLPTTLAINRLPLVITGPGDYKTRDGRRVTIRQIVMYAPTPSHNTPRHEVTAFEAKGSLWRMFRGKEQPRQPEIWHLSGRNMPVNEHGRDIVEYWPCAEFDQFLRGYMTALWWSTSDEVDGEEVHLDEFEPSEGAVRKCTKDCFHFFWANKHDLDKAASRYDLSRGDGADTGYDFAGHDFALTRNGHGAGFWDRKELKVRGLDERLTKASDEAGRAEAYLGDDKLIYIG